MSGNRRTFRKDCRGSALLVTMVMLGLIAVLAVSVSRSVSGAAFELSVARAALNNEADLRAGIELGVAAILKLGDDVRSGEAETDLPDRHMLVRFTNERARIDLNRADADMLTGLLKSNGVDDSEAATLAANVVQWRGGPAQDKLGAPSDEERVFGQIPGVTHLSIGLTDEHKSAPPPQAGTRFFFHPAELLLVPGFSKALVRTIFPFITVANGANQINPFIADGGALQALPDSTPSKVEGFINARDGNTSAETAMLMLGVDKKFLTQDASRGWRLQIVSSRRGMRSHRCEAIVAILKDDGEPYQVIYVVDDPGQI